MFVGTAVGIGGGRLRGGIGLGLGLIAGVGLLRGG